MIQFFIPGIPVAQPRQRHALIGGHVRNYTPTKHPVTAFKSAARLAARQAYQGPPLEGPLTVTIVAVFPRPKSKRFKSKPTHRYPHSSKPDCDNIAKSILDCLNQVLWYDDSQVSRLIVEKVVASGGEQPHVVVIVENHHDFEESNRRETDKPVPEN